MCGWCRSLRPPFPGGYAPLCNRPYRIKWAPCRDGGARRPAKGARAGPSRPRAPAAHAVRPVVLSASYGCGYGEVSGRNSSTARRGANAGARNMPNHRRSHLGKDALPGDRKQKSAAASYGFPSDRPGGVGILVSAVSFPISRPLCGPRSRPSSGFNLGILPRRWSIGVASSLPGRSRGRFKKR